MKRRLNPAVMARTNLSFKRWRQWQNRAAWLAGGLVTLISVGIHWHSPSFAGALEALSLGILVWAMIRLSLRLTHAITQRQALRMAHAIENAQRKGYFIPPSSHGWAVFERMQNSLQQLLSSRDEKILRLQHELDYYRQLSESMQGLELVFNRNGRLTWINPAAETQIGHSAAACLAATDPIELWVYEKDQATLREMITLGLQGQEQESTELRLQRQDGSHFWSICRCYPLYDQDGQFHSLRLSAQNIQPRKDADLKLLETVAALRRTQALKEHYLSRSNDEKMRLTALLEILDVGILFVDGDRRVVYINQRCADIWQLGERSAIVGMRDSVLLEKTAPLRIDNAAYLTHIEEVIAERSASARYDVFCQDGRALRETSSLVQGAEGERAIGRVWIYEDITDELLTQTRLIELAERDPLTNLYNRRRFHESLDRQLAEAKRRGEHLAIALFDLDDFKSINDRFGHPGGDEVLRRLASEINSIVRRNEVLFRLGGDEFAILAHAPSTEHLINLAERVVNKTAAMHFQFDGQATNISISLGIAMTHANATPNAEALLIAADQAMYKAKNEGKNRWAIAPGHA